VRIPLQSTFAAQCSSFSVVSKPYTVRRFSIMASRLGGQVAHIIFREVRERFSKEGQEMCAQRSAYK